METKYGARESAWVALGFAVIFGIMSAAEILATGDSIGAATFTITYAIGWWMIAPPGSTWF